MDIVLAQTDVVDEIGMDWIDKATHDASQVLDGALEHHVEMVWRGSMQSKALNSKARRL